MIRNQDAHFDREGGNGTRGPESVDAALPPRRVSALELLVHGKDVHAKRVHCFFLALRVKVTTNDGRESASNDAVRYGITKGPPPILPPRPEGA